MGTRASILNKVSTKCLFDKNNRSCEVIFSIDIFSCKEAETKVRRQGQDKKVDVYKMSEKCACDRQEGEREI